MLKYLTLQKQIFLVLVLRINASLDIDLAKKSLVYIADSYLHYEGTISVNSVPCAQCDLRASPCQARSDIAAAAATENAGLVYCTKCSSCQRVPATAAHLVQHSASCGLRR